MASGSRRRPCFTVSDGYGFKATVSVTPASSFCLLTIGNGATRAEPAGLQFDLKAHARAPHSQTGVAITPIPRDDDQRRINPNTDTAPVFRTDDRR